ncbi:hypothetical protein [Streptomyces malaysiensis]|uniref:hypothetical protein n=1 Tax=Streptomyces malaysiensis TaxID=92644 RepID=UPI0036BD94B6
MFDAIAEAYNTGHRAAVAELGALPDRARGSWSTKSPRTRRPLTSIIPMTRVDITPDSRTFLGYVPRVRSSAAESGLPR